MEIKIGNARCSTRGKDLEAQRNALLDLVVAEDRINTDHGPTGTCRDRPGLGQPLAVLREGDTLVVSKLDRLARSVPDARGIARQLERKGVKLALGAAVHDYSDPMGKMFFNIVATFAELEADLISMRTREGMAIAEAKGRLPGGRGQNSRKNSRKSSGGCMTRANARSAISPRSSPFRDRPSTACCAGGRSLRVLYQTK